MQIVRENCKRKTNKSTFRIMKSMEKSYNKNLSETMLKKENLGISL